MRTTIAPTGIVRLVHEVSITDLQQFPFAFLAAAADVVDQISLWLVGVSS